MYGYIYKTTNQINSKIYIGQHRVKKQEIDKSYYGSGKLILEAIKKYGKENFKIEILEWCETEKDLEEKEIYYISKYKSESIYGNYNMSDGGFVPRLSGKLNGNYGKHRKRSKEENEHLSKVTKGHKPTFTRKHTLEERLKMSEKVRKSNLTKDKSFYKEIAKKIIGNKVMNKDNIYKRVPKNEIKYHLENGWKFGARSKKGKYKNRNSNNNQGKIRINDGEHNKFILPQDLEKYLKNCWIKGRLQKTKK
jgi:group I intron endonuclease